MRKKLSYLLRESLVLVYTATLRLLPWLPQAVTFVFFSQRALQECLHPNRRVDMPQSKLPCSFQMPASTQGDTSTTAVLNQVNWPSHLKRLSIPNRTHSPQPSSVIKLVFVEATPTVPEHTGVLFCTEEPLIGLPSGVTHQQYPV